MHAPSYPETPLDLLGGDTAPTLFDFTNSRFSKAQLKPLRHFIRATLTASGVDDFAGDTVAMLGNEVMTNIIEHCPPDTRTRVVLAHDHQAGLVTFAAEDDYEAVPAFPPPGEPRLDDESGRGLAIIASLSDRYGVTRLLGGKRVWFIIYTSRREP